MSDLESLAAEIAEVRALTGEEDLDLRRRTEFCEHEIELLRTEVASLASAVEQLATRSARAKLREGSERAKGSGKGKKRQRAAARKQSPTQKSGKAQGAGGGKKRQRAAARKPPSGKQQDAQSDA